MSRFSQEPNFRHGEVIVRETSLRFFSGCTVNVNFNNRCYGNPEELALFGGISRAAFAVAHRVASRRSLQTLLQWQRPTVLSRSWLGLFAARSRCSDIIRNTALNLILDYR